MANTLLKPDDPEVVAYVVDRIRNMSEEELLGRLRAQPGWDEAWLNNPSKSPNAQPRASRVVTVHSRLRTRGS